MCVVAMGINVKLSCTTLRPKPLLMRNIDTHNMRHNYSFGTMGRQWQKSIMGFQEA